MARHGENFKKKSRKTDGYNERCHQRVLALVNFPENLD
jgi:hypothetical protein